jgi:uncharacterized protein (TIGR02147 family)
MKTSQDELREKILKKFKEQKKQNSSFSLRSLARNLGTSPATLSEFLNGKRNISSVIARKILSNLDLGSIKDSKSSSSRFTSISDDRSALISDWAYFAILSLMEVSDFKSDAKWVSERLSISEAKVRSIFKELLAFGLIEESPLGYLTTDTELITSDDIQSKALRARHLENTLRAKNSIEKDELQDRDFSFMTLAIGKNDLKKYKKLIRKVQDDIVKIQSKNSKDCVYEFVFQVFPVSK